MAGKLRHGQWLAAGIHSIEVMGWARGTYILTTEDGNFARFMID